MKTYSTAVKSTSRRDSFIVGRIKPVIASLVVLLGSVVLGHAQEIAQYGFEGNVLDGSGNGLNGVNHGVTFATGVIGAQAGVFNGVSYVDLNNATNSGPLKPALPVTISAWIYLNSTSGTQTIFSSDEFDTTMYAGYVLQVSAGALGCGFGNGAGGNGSMYRQSLGGSAILATGQWYHVAAVIQSATNMQLYVNGLPVNGNYSGTGVTMAYTATTSKIGTCNASNFFNGNIDDLQIYHSALDASQIALLAEGVMGYWAFDEGLGTTTADGTGNNFIGTLINAPAWVTGVVGDALSFNGTNNYVNLGNASATSALKPTLPVTIGGWVKVNNTTGNQIVFSSDEFDVSKYAGYDLQITNGIVSCNYGSGTGGNGPGFRRSKTGTTVLTPGTWYYVAAVIQGATTMSVYVNGVDDGGTYSGTGGTMAYTAATSRIAVSNVSNYFNGTLDEISVYNSPLSAYQLGAKETVGGGTVSSPAVGPQPSYGIGGTGFTLVKNWHFGSDGTITDLVDMRANFQYHDLNGTVDNGGHYGAMTLADDDNTNSDDDQTNDYDRLEGQNWVGEMVNGVAIPAVRTFFTDSLRTYIVPMGTVTTITSPATAPSPPNNPAAYNAGCGSFAAKWTLPAGGSKLGQDILWETRVRYVTPPGFWFSLWTVTRPYLSGYGPEQDVVETFGYNNQNGNTNYNGAYWHSNSVGGSDTIDYQVHQDWQQGMGDVGINSYDATQYHIWTWLYRKDDTYAMYVDGTQVQSGSKPYPWTSTGTTAGTAEPVYFNFDATWDDNQTSNDNYSTAVSNLTGTYYEFNYSRVYLR